MEKYNFKIIVSYDGTNYKGWQYQRPEVPTIQGELIKALTIIAKKKVIVTGSSRTDAGVHSLGLTANFLLPINIEDISLQKALNSLLPQDIRVVECKKMDRSFNARFSALGKTYLYKIYYGQVSSPFESRFYHHIPYPLSLKNMRMACEYFIGSKDFSSFTSDEPQKNRMREIDFFNMKVSRKLISFEIKGKSFLRYMVRNMVGTIIDVGRGKINPQDIPDIFEAKNRCAAGQTAPAKGLTLKTVHYLEE